MKKLLQEIKNSIVFIGRVENGHSIVVGTGFLIQIDGFVHIVTAKHVVWRDFSILGTFGNTKQMSKMVYKPFSFIYKDNLNWISHNNQNIDIAILPYLINSDDNSSFISSDLLSNNLDELLELSDIFYASFQPGINNLEVDGSVDPIYRKGFVSRKNNDGTFYIDATAFPGNSGSPIFNYPNAIEINDNGVVIGNQKPIKILGVMSAYVPYEDVAISRQTSRPRVIFEENTGISKVFSAHYIKEIINQQNFQDQLNRLKMIQPLKTSSK